MSPHEKGVHVCHLRPCVVLHCPPVGVLQRIYGIKESLGELGEKCEAIRSSAQVLCRLVWKENLSGKWGLEQKEAMTR